MFCWSLDIFFTCITSINSKENSEFNLRFHEEKKNTLKFVYFLHFGKFYEKITNTFNFMGFICFSFQKYRELNRKEINHL